MRYYVILTCLLLMAACNQKNNSGWQTLDFGIFTMQAPAGWEKIKLQGTEVFNGGLTNGKDTLVFSCGRYLRQTEGEDPGRHKYATDTVNGLLAYVIIPDKEGDGVVSVSIEDLAKCSNFVMQGRNIASTGAVLRMFKSIRFSESDTTINPPLISGKFQVHLTGNGKKLFIKNCLACHSKRNPAIVTALRSAKTERNFDGLYNFITNRKVTGADTAAVQLAFKQHHHCIEFRDMSAEELQLIIEYVN